MIEKKRLIIALAIFVSINIIFLLLNFSLISIDDTDKNTEISLVKSGDDKAKPKILNGLSIVKTGEYYLQSQKGISSSIKRISVKPFRITSHHTFIKPQLEAKRIARATNNCVFGKKDDIMSGKVFSHSCANIASFFLNEYDNYSKKSLILSNFETSIEQSLPFNSGLVGLGRGEGGWNITYFDDGGIKLRQVSDLDGASPNSDYLLSSNGGYFYLLSIRDEIIFKMKNIDDRPEIINIAGIDSGIDKTLSFSVTDTSIILMQGEDSEDGTITEPYISHMSTIDIPSKKIELTDLSSIKEGIESYKIINDNTIALLSNSQSLSMLDISKDSHLIKVDDSVSDYAVYDDTLFIIIEGRIYSYNQQDQQLDTAFSSANIVATKLQIVDGLLLFNGYAKSDSDSVNLLYTLLDNPVGLDDKYRQEDILPFGSITLPISWMDYFENRLYIVPQLKSLNYNVGNSEISYNHTEYASSIDTIKASISEINIPNMKKYSVEFSPF